MCVYYLLSTNIIYIAEYETKPPFVKKNTIIEEFASLHFVSGNKVVKKSPGNKVVKKSIFTAA